MRGRPKPLSDYVGASNVLVYVFRRYVVVIYSLPRQSAKTMRSFRIWCLDYKVTNNFWGGNRWCYVFDNLLAICIILAFYHSILNFDLGTSLKKFGPLVVLERPGILMYHLRCSRCLILCLTRSTSWSVTRAAVRVRTWKARLIKKCLCRPWQCSWFSFIICKFWVGNSVMPLIGETP